MKGQHELLKLKPSICNNFPHRNFGTNYNKGSVSYSRKNIRVNKKFPKLKDKRNHKLNCANSGPDYNNHGSELFWKQETTPAFSRPEAIH